MIHTSLCLIYYFHIDINPPSPRPPPSPRTNLRHCLGNFFSSLFCSAGHLPKACMLQTWAHPVPFPSLFSVLSVSHGSWRMAFLNRSDSTADGVLAIFLPRRTSLSGNVYETTFDDLLPSISFFSRVNSGIIYRCVYLELLIQSHWSVYVNKSYFLWPNKQSNIPKYKLFVGIFVQLPGNVQHMLQI